MPSFLPTPLRRALTCGVLVTGTVGGLLATAPASAERSAPAEAPAAPAAPVAPTAPASPDLPGLPQLSAELREVGADSRALRQADQRYREVAGTHAAHQAARVELDLSASTLALRARALRAEVAAAQARAAGLQARLDAVESAIGDLSTRLFVAGGSTARVDAALTQEQPSINDHDRRAVLGSASMDVLLAEQAAYEARVDDALDRAAAARAELDAIEPRRADARGSREAAVQQEVASARRVASVRVDYEEARALATVDEVDFQLVALDAYHRAARTVHEEDPACGVRWWAVAGISRVEGHHGTYGGAELDTRGDTSKPIIGIQLNGTNETRAIPDSDGGALDGDPHFDRAVGPMQFIPQTWQRFRSDGNEDGTATPFNLYDATLAAARYLCRASRGLDADPGLRTAYFSYNHSDAYVEQVLAHARAYQQRVPLDDAPA